MSKDLPYRVKTKCPKCGAPMIYQTGVYTSVWCTDVDCDYMIDLRPYSRKLIEANDGN